MNGKTELQLGNTQQGRKNEEQNDLVNTELPDSIIPGAIILCPDSKTSSAINITNSTHTCTCTCTYTCTNHDSSAGASVSARSPKVWRRVYMGSYAVA